VAGLGLDDEDVFLLCGSDHMVYVYGQVCTHMVAGDAMMSSYRRVSQRADVRMSDWGPDCCCGLQAGGRFKVLRSETLFPEIKTQPSSYAGQGSMLRAHGNGHWLELIFSELARRVTFDLSVEQSTGCVD
jgi:hypothetical protein